MIQIAILAWMFALLVLGGCSHGLQEVAYMDGDPPHGYVVSVDTVASRWAAGQPHQAGIYYCMKQHTKQQMEEALAKSEVPLRKFYECEPLSSVARHRETNLALDQSLLSQYSGPMSSALLGAGVGLGLAYMGGGDTVTANANANANASTRIRGPYRDGYKW